MEEIKRNQVHLVVSEECRETLKSLKIYPRETFADVIERLIQEHKNMVSPKQPEEETNLFSETSSLPTMLDTEKTPEEELLKTDEEHHQEEEYQPTEEEI